MPGHHARCAAACRCSCSRAASCPRAWLSALGFIPPAAFAALVANDLLSPGMFDAGVWPAAMPLVAAAVVVVVARKTKSLLWCALAGCASYALLAFCFAPGVA